MSDTPEPSRADYDFAVERFHAGMTAAAVEAQLVERGLTPQAAKGVVADLMIQMVRHEAGQMLRDGMLPQQVEKHFRERGLSDEAAKAVVDNARSDPAYEDYAEPAAAGGNNPVLMVLGAIVFVIGVFLFIGNVSGAFPTIPCAGWLGMVVGGGIWGAGKKGG